LHDVSVRVRTSEITVVLGPNGAGKSTLAKALLGLLALRSGRVYVADREVTGQTPYRLVRQGVAYLPQLRNIFDELTVIENLEMGGYTVRSGLAKRVDEVLAIFPDLAVDRKKKGGALSGGQQRMLGLARMLMTEPVAAVLDEPTAGLSPMYADRVWEHITRIRDSGVGVLVVEQNAAMAMEHADELLLLNQGREVLSGHAADLRDHDDIVRILVG
jgi:ABC-type branched-subunit amino acid transport system ATPase component